MKNSTHFFILLSLLLFNNLMNAQSFYIIKGNVVSQQNEALVGVTIVCNERQTLTDVEGNFSLKVPDEALNTLI